MKFTLFFLQKGNVRKLAFWRSRKLRGIVLNSWRLDYFELLDIFPRDVKGEHFAKWTAKCKILGILRDKKMENLCDQGCAKIRDLVDSKADGESWICSSYPHWLKTTLHSAEIIAKLLGKWAMQHLKLWNFICKTFRQYVRNYFY